MGYMGNSGGDSMNQTPRIRKGKYMFCGAEVNIFQLYYTHLSEYVDVSIPICPKCAMIKEIEES